MSSKETKKKFCKIIKFINNRKNKKINKELTPEIKKHLKHLIKMWKNSENVDMEYYFKMKEHHTHINGRIENEILKKMWDEYFMSGLEFRTKLMALNYEKSNNKATHRYLPPKNISQKIARETIYNLTKNIKEDHCLICGDTEKDGKIVKVKTFNDGYKHFCEFCYNVQMNM